MLRRALWLPAAGAGLAATAMHYYLTHPQRIIVDLPADLAADARHVHLQAGDGARLHAVWLPAATPTDRTIVHLHGYNGSAGLLVSRVLLVRRGVTRLPMDGAGEPLCVWPVVRAALARGYNFLLTDIRSHGQSGGVWDSSGRLAVADAMAWAKWLRVEHGQLWAGLWGHSFGASIGLALAAKASGGGFDAMVLDSPALTADGVYSGLMYRPVYWAVQPVLQRLSNRELADELARARVWMPTLLIHGAADRHVPAWQSERAYELIRNPDAPERAALWTVPGADHLEALGVEERAYIARTLDWYEHWFS